MREVVIQVQGLGKMFYIGSKTERYKTLRDTIAEAFTSPWRALTSAWSTRRSRRDVLWALKDITFEVRRGDVVAIIGRNGAGKSALLKILSRITEPTEGWAETRGRVGSLLEVGTGFHAELTGRENIYLNSAIMGMRRAEIARKFDEIVAFAEVEPFIDTPVKHYSTGMGLRLGFAVAAHLEPDILIVDEVLAVGDAEFQKKCLGKMQDVAGGGRTVLFVSHNLVAVQSLCTRAIWLDKGRIRAAGEVEPVIAEYLENCVADHMSDTWEFESAPGNEDVRLKSVSVRPGDESESGQITLATAFQLEFSYWNLKPNTRLTVRLILFNQDGVIVFNTLSSSDPNWHGRPFPAGLFQSVCEVPGHLLNSGRYWVKLLMVKDSGTVVFRYEDILAFEVQETGSRDGWFGKWPGAVRPELEWRTDLIEEELPAKSRGELSGASARRS